MSREGRWHSGSQLQVAAAGGGRRLQAGQAAQRWRWRCEGRWHNASQSQEAQRWQRQVMLVAAGQGRPGWRSEVVQQWRHRSCVTLEQAYAACRAAAADG